MQYSAAIEVDAALLGLQLQLVSRRLGWISEFDHPGNHGLGAGPVLVSSCMGKKRLLGLWTKSGQVVNHQALDQLRATHATYAAQKATRE